MQTKTSRTPAKQFTPMAPVVIDGRMQIEGRATVLIQRGLVEQINLPGLRGPQAVRSTIDGQSVYALRLKQDFVCVIMPEQLARQRDSGFARLMAGIAMLGD